MLETYTDMALGLRARALFALADRERAEREWLTSQAHRTCEEILGERLHVIRLDGATTAYLEGDGLEFKFEIRERKAASGKGSNSLNASINGLHTETVHELSVKNGSTWSAIESLSELGGVVRLMQSLGRLPEVVVGDGMEEDDPELSGVD